MRIGTLFSGIGAPEQGAKRVYGDALEMVFACEWDKFARQSFEANYDIAPEHFHKDVNDLDGTEYQGKVDVLVGGSPCQAFSIAGLRNGTDDERGQLIYQYIRIVDEVKAPTIVYENVKGMLSIGGGRTIKEFVQALRDIGYYCHYEVVNTKNHGVPQNRERIFLVGFLNHDHYHRFKFADKQPLAKRLKDVLEDDVDEKWYLSEKLIKYFSETHKERFGSTFGGRFQPKDKEGIANCLRKSGDTCPTDTYIIDNGRYRKPTSREKLNIQDFPKDFKIVVSDAQITMQAGNSMSVNVLEMIFKQIEKAKSGEKHGTLFDFL